MKYLIPFLLLLLSNSLYAQSSEPPFDAFIAVDKEPICLNYEEVRAQITFPQNGACVEGMVVVRILLDEGGYYIKHKVLKGHDYLTAVCESHIPKLQFTPAMQSGKAVKYWMSVPFRFKLEE